MAKESIKATAWGVLITLIAVFPPLVVGGVHQATGAFTWGFILLSLFSAICLIVVLKKSDSTIRGPIRAV